MQRNRVLMVFGIAWLSALLLSWWVFRQSTAPESRDLVFAVAAVQDLPVGKRIQAENVKLVRVDRKDLPKGAFLKTADLVDRATSVPVSENELVLSAKLAMKGSGEGLASLIEPGTRAVSVQVNEISGVSGFIQPGTRVDVLFTRVFSNGDAATTTILQNIRVIAFGRQFDPAVKPNAADTARPTVATLLLTQVDAEKLVLAQQRGRLHFSLRNGLDELISDPSEPVKSVDLGIEDPVKPKPAPPVVPVVVAKPPVPSKADKPENAVRVIRIFRGDKLTELTLK